ncbi:MAG: DUF4167 domain-containing protein [Rhizobiaceae bacterium]
MRQSHQKSRSRGRNRKPQNPMSRNYESNGPDVKIRGNAAHIADKYSTLARDALSNGDTVMAENYLQHAEHYNRIIAAAQAQKAEENAAAAANGRGPQPDVQEGKTEGSSEAGSATEHNNKSVSENQGEAEEADAETKDRKNGRGRRTKRVAVDPNSTNGSDKSSEEKTAAKTEGDVSTEVEVVTEDAASLPQSITGGLQAEES